MTEQQLAEIEARAAAATPGPVQALGGGRLGWDLEPEMYPEAGEWYGVRRMFARKADAVFYAAARTDVPALLAEVRRLQAALHRDQTGLAAALSHIRQSAEAARWCGVAGSRGNYAAEEWSEAALRWEIEQALEAIIDLATVALTESGTLAHAADGCRDE